MVRSLAAACAFLSFAAAGCGGARQPDAGAAPTAPPSSPPLRAFRLSAGLRLVLQPNLPGVGEEDLPGSAHRDVEVLSYERGQLGLKWTGTVRQETPESSHRREEWVRARANAPATALPPPGVVPEYETRTVTGTLFFPDFGTAHAFLLPALWPEGSATLRGTGAIWLARDVFDDLHRAGEAQVPFFVSSRLLKEPASSVMARASERMGEETAGVGGPGRWRDVTPGRRYSLRLAGEAAEVASFSARNWFGRYEVLDEAENPLVLSVLPDPPSPVLLDLFAPANIQRTLLGYRVGEVEPGRGEAR